jgi:hypothetical protein
LRCGRRPGTAMSFGSHTIRLSNESTGPNTILSTRPVRDGSRPPRSLALVLATATGVLGPMVAPSGTPREGSDAIRPPSEVGPGPVVPGPGPSRRNDAGRDRSCGYHVRTRERRWSNLSSHKPGTLEVAGR